MYLHFFFKSKTILKNRLSA